MFTIQGKQVHPGIAIGPVHLYRRREAQSGGRSSLTPLEEQARFRLAARQAAQQLRQLHQTSSFRLGEELAAIFLVQEAMLQDPKFLDAIDRHLLNGMTAEYAVTAAGEEGAALLEASDNPYLYARAADARDLSRRLASVLSGTGDSFLRPTPGILLAADLCPSETVGLDPRSLLGLASSRGSSNSHSAILARAMGIPSLTGIEIDPAWEGRLAVLDGDAGVLYLDPDEETLRRAQSRYLQQQARLDTLRAAPLGPCATKDGRPVLLCANIASPQEAVSALEWGCQGIGLFRSEFLFLGRDTCPTEEEQFIAYQQTVLAMGGQPVIIRTLDVGADKQAPCLKLPVEVNPALGFRGIRYSLAHPELFRTQLRAILRAAAYGPLSVMFPMVTSVEEIQAAKALLEECRQELDALGLPYGDLELGTMIETPAAAILADRLADEVDFFSLGTNDLTQYLLAADRQNPALDGLCDPHHPALKRLIQHTVEEGHRRGCRVGMCGELAADPTMTRWLLEIGLDELSVSPAALLELREHICNLELSPVT